MRIECPYCGLKGRLRSFKEIGVGVYKCLKCDGLFTIEKEEKGRF